MLEPLVKSNDGTWDYDVVWVPTNHRYENPLSAAMFSLTGEWLDVHNFGPLIERRGLSRYPVEVRGDEVWLTAKVPLPGALAATATP